MPAKNVLGTDCRLGPPILLPVSIETVVVTPVQKTWGFIWFALKLQPRFLPSQKQPAMICPPIPQWGFGSSAGRTLVFVRRALKGLVSQRCAKVNLQATHLGT